MIDKGVAKRYARALFGAAQKEGRLDRVLADLESLEALLKLDAALIQFLGSPHQLDETKEGLVRRLFEGRTDDLVVRLLLLLFRKGRILHLLDVIDAYRAAVEEHQGIAPAHVITAVVLDADLRDRMQKELERLTGKKVKIRPRVDPKIIGGALVMVEGKVFDRSLRHELERMRDKLLAVRVHK